MKIDRPIPNISDSEKTEQTENTAETDSIQLPQNAALKTDSVEMKQNSFYTFDSNGLPKLDPSKTQNVDANSFPAAMMPGVPFREKVELPKTLPDGSSMDSGLAKGDLGFGKTSTGPNHMGVDLKTGGMEIRNQLNDALALKTGSGGQSSQTGGSQKAEGKFESQFARPGMELKAGGFGELVDGAKNWVKSLFTTDGAVNTATDGVLERYGPPAGMNEAMDLLRGPKLVQDVTGDATDLLRGVDSAAHPEKRLDEIFDASNEEQKYTNPEGDPSGVSLPALTPEEAARLVNSRKLVNTTPSNTEDAAPITIDPKRVYDPLKDPLVTDGNPEMYESSNVASSPENLEVSGSAKGPDTVNPNDPDLGGSGGPIVIDPNRPK